MRIGCRGNEVVRGARRRLAWLVGLTIAVAPPALAQSSDTMASIAIPAQPGAIDLGTGKLPGATASEAWHSQYGSVFARNVTVATLTPVLPDPAKANSTAVIVSLPSCIARHVRFRTHLEGLRTQSTERDC